MNDDAITLITFVVSLRSRAPPRSFVWGGGGGQIHGHPNPPTPKIHFLLGFRPFYFDNVGLFQNFTCVKKKVAEI